jgi:hypothetical protein
MSMRRLYLLGIALALQGCGAPLTSPQCRPTVVQPPHGSVITLIARVQGSPNLVAVAGDAPGVLLFVSRANLVGHSDSEIDALPVAAGGK